jgi:hypothetical protein
MRLAWFAVLVSTSTSFGQTLQERIDASVQGLQRKGGTVRSF